MRKERGRKNGMSTPYYIYMRTRETNDVREGDFLATGKIVFPGRGERSPT